MKENWTEFVAFSRKERNGLIILLSILAVIIVFPRFFCAPELALDEGKVHLLEAQIALAQGNGKYHKKYGANGKERKHETVEKVAPAEETYADAGEEKPDSMISPSDQRAADEDDEKGSRPRFSGIAHSLFPFDPNSISSADWKRLGISEKVVRIIFNYLSKGGSFRKPEDLGRIYGMKETDVKKLLPFVKIAPHPLRKEVVDPTVLRSQEKQSGYKKKQFSLLDINQADTAAWSSLPGIGSKLALRILNYREKLGGFYSTDQVAETWTLPDSTFRRIKPWLQCGEPALKKIFINKASAEELRQHPYLRWDIANAIINYRKQHGPLRSAGDLQQIILLSQVLIQKIAPYLEFEAAN